MIEPFLKWPGGKRWLVGRHKELFPKKYKRYIEPFLGGAAVYFSLRPSRALLSDSNAELVNTYACLKAHSAEIERGLVRYQRLHCAQFYYEVREQNPRDPVKRALRFLYLNRTCFNGIYRVNLDGKFNVPIGTKSTVIFPKGYLEKVADALKQASMAVWDFEVAIGKAGHGDFIYADPHTP